MEVLARFELADQSFADSCLTTWLQYHLIKTGTRVRSDFILLERVTRHEVATTTLARWRSTGCATPASGASGRNRTNDTRIFRSCDSSYINFFCSIMSDFPLNNGFCGIIGTTFLPLFPYFPFYFVSIFVSA